MLTLFTAAVRAMGHHWRIGLMCVLAVLMWYGWRQYGAQQYARGYEDAMTSMHAMLTQQQQQLNKALEDASRTYEQEKHHAQSAHRQNRIKVIRAVGQSTTVCLPDGVREHINAAIAAGTASR